MPGADAERPSPHPADALARASARYLAELERLTRAAPAGEDRAQDPDPCARARAWREISERWWREAASQAAPEVRRFFATLVDQTARWLETTARLAAAGAFRDADALADTLGDAIGPGIDDPPGAPSAPAIGLPFADALAALAAGARSAAGPADEAAGRRLEAARALQRALADWGALGIRLRIDALERLRARLADGDTAAELRDPAALYEAWLACADGAYRELATSESWASVYARLVNASTAFARESAEAAAPIARALGLASRADLDAATAEIQALRREVRRLRARVERADGAPPGGGEAP